MSRCKLSATELAFVKHRRKMPRRGLHQAFVAEFSRDDISCDQLRQLCKYRGWATGLNGRFEKGKAPRNSANLTYPIGSEHLSRGYLKRKVNNGPVRHLRFRTVHLLRWEEANGPLPAGFVLKCKGDILNTDPSNWQAVPAGVVGRLNGKSGRDYDDAPFELKATMMAVAKLKHCISAHGTASKSLGASKAAGRSISGKFEAGHAALNKWNNDHPNIARTRFKSGNKPAHKIKYPGHEYVRQGFIQVRIEETDPRSGRPYRYVAKHRLLWEQVHGPIPAGMVLKCKGDKLNTDPSNFELVPNAMQWRLSGNGGRGYDEASTELKPTIMAVAKLEHALGSRVAAENRAKPTKKRDRTRRGRDARALKRQDKKRYRRNSATAIKEEA